MPAPTAFGLADLPPGELLAIARRVCTEKQLFVLEAKARGLGYRRIAATLGVSVETVRGHWQAGARAIAKELQGETPPTRRSEQRGIINGV